MAVCKTCGTTIQPGFTFCPVCGSNVLAQEDAIVCLTCNTPNPIGTRFCKGCGAVLFRKPKKVQCAVCGSENSPDALYCVICGSEMPGEVDLALKSESVEKLKALVPEIAAYKHAIGIPFPGVTKSELNAMTYICPVCGKRNKISDEKCARCGRDKNRTAELIAKGRITPFEEATVVPDKRKKPPVIEFEPVNHEFVNGKKAADAAPIGALNNGMFPGAYGNPYGQVSPIVQPLAIVPYVTQEQPLWQTTSLEKACGAGSDAVTLESVSD